MTACNSTKHLEEGQALYTGAQVKFEDPEKVQKKSKLQAEMLLLARPKPNRKFFSLFRFRLWVYNSFGNGDKEKSLGKWMKKKLGEAPVLYNAGTADYSAKLMEKYLYDHGYFDAIVAVDPNIKKQKASVIYTATAKEQYTIRETFLPLAKDTIGKLLKTLDSKSLIKNNEPYNLGKLSAERIRLTNQIRNEGFFKFNQQHLYYLIDTTLGNHKLDVYFRVKDPSDSTKHQRTAFNHIFIYPDYALDDDLDSIPLDTLHFKDITLFQKSDLIRPRTLRRAILIRKGQLFTQRKHEYTLNHLHNLGLFKFVSLKYKHRPYEGVDSLDTYLYLTPDLLQTVNVELEASTRTGNYLGTSATVSYANRNIFKGAELFSTSFSMGAETQLGDGTSFINTLELNLRGDLFFPKLIAPFKLKNVEPYYMPKTQLSVADNFQRRLAFYTINAFNVDFGYLWQATLRRKHRFFPIAISNIQIFDTTPDFDEVLNGNVRLKNSFENVFVLGNRYSFTYTDQSANPLKNYLYFEGSMEFSGNVAWLAAKAFGKDNVTTYEFLKQPFSQFARFDIDARYYWKMGPSRSLVTRLVAGIGVPYGNSDVLPYAKQFFIGGTTSVRAFRWRSLGPGIYVNPEIENGNTNFIDQTGDLKLEANIEYRFDLMSFLEGAAFWDIGNVWLLKEEAATPGGQFNKDFYKQLAMGAGLGLRLDLTFFVLRVDAAFPVRQPVIDEGMQWTLNNDYFLRKGWLKDNIIYNLAIGYPF